MSERKNAPQEHVRSFLRIVFSGWFWTWLVLAIILVLSIMGLGAHGHEETVDYLAGIIMATLMLLPVRNVLFQGIVFALKVRASRQPTFKRDYDSWGTMYEPGEKDKRASPLIDVVTFILTGMLATVAACIWLQFPGVAYRVVSAFLQSRLNILSAPLAVAFDIICTLVLVRTFWWFQGEIFKRDNNDFYLDPQGHINWATSWWKILLMAGVFYGKLIIHGLLMRFEFGDFLLITLIWSMIVGIPLLYFEVRKFIQIHTS
ncbi:MAG: hypothetical protein IJ867_05925 [Clostridia bacterium]|nr:hypothetical protein [Clostridia bacterium]